MVYFFFFFFYADVHMPELSAEGDTVMEGLTLFMIKPYFFSREVCLGGQQRMRRQVWEELLCSYSALHAKHRERESGGANKAKHDFFNTRFTRIFLRIMVGRQKICTQRKVR